MIKDFSDIALNYLLDELDPAQRVVFEEQLTRYPGARIALEECADWLGMLRRQASHLPFFGGRVEEEVAHLVHDASLSAQRPFWQGLHRLRQIIAS